MMVSMTIKNKLKVPKNIFQILRKSHIYLSLFLVLPLCLVVLTGGILATIPLFRDHPPEPPIEQVLLSIEKFEAEQSYNFAMFRNDIGQIRLISFTEDGFSMDSVGLASGEIIPNSTMETVYLVVRELHKNLLLNLGWLVELCTWAMIIIVLSGCIILPRYTITSSLLGYHIGLGLLVTVPLMVFSVSGIVMRDMHREVAKKPSPMMAQMKAPTQVPVIKLPMLAIKTALLNQGALRVTQIKKMPNGYSIAFVDHNNIAKSFDGTSITTKQVKKSSSWGDIHLGKWGGLPMIFLYAIASYIALISMFCGYYRWLKRWSAKKRRAKKLVAQARCYGDLQNS